MAGFIPVDMEDNGNGNPNEYHPASFKQMIKATKKAVADGFDIREMLFMFFLFDPIELLPNPLTMLPI
jgi:hypothetical protein